MLLIRRCHHPVENRASILLCITGAGTGGSLQWVIRFSQSKRSHAHLGATQASRDAESLQALLETEGYEVALATDGREALQKLDTLEPAVILLDLMMMPRMSGIEFIQELQRSGRRAAIPIIILTADGRTRQKAAQVGAEGYLAKPFDITALLDEIDRLV